MKLFIDAVGMTMGGGVTVLNNILEYFPKINPEIQIILAISSKANEHLNLSANISVINVDAYESSLKRMFWQQVRVHHVAKKHQATLFLSIVNIGAAFPQVPQVVYYHQALLFNKYPLTIFFRGGTLIKYYLQKIFVILGFISSRKIITQTETVKKYISKLTVVNPHKLVSVYPGIPISKVKESLKLFFPPNRFKVLYFTNPASYKNFEVLLRAAQILLERKCAVSFVLPFTSTQHHPVHSEFVNSYICAIKERNLEDYFMLIPPIPNASSYDLLSNIDILVHPSFVESFPQSFIEAMYMKKPLIAADTEYAREIAGDAGVFFPPSNEVVLANLIQECMQRSAYNDLSNKMMRRSTMFDSVLAAQLLYEELLNI